MRTLAKIRALDFSQLTLDELTAVQEELQQHLKKIEDDPASQEKPGGFFRYTKKARSKRDAIAMDINRATIEKKKRNGTYNKEATEAGYSGRNSNRR